MTLDDEFKVYDSCTADALQIGDQIVFNSEHIEVHSVDDDINMITITGYSYEQDDDIEYSIDPDHKINLWMVGLD